jgi:hypothetical protein
MRLDFTLTPFLPGPIFVLESLCRDRHESPFYSESHAYFLPDQQRNEQLDQHQRSLLHREALQLEESILVREVSCKSQQLDHDPL